MEQYRDQNLSTLSKNVIDQNGHQDLNTTLYLNRPPIASKDSYFSPFNTTSKDQKNALLASAMRVKQIKSPISCYQSNSNPFQLPQLEKITENLS